MSSNENAPPGPRAAPAPGDRGGPIPLISTTPASRSDRVLGLAVVFGLLAALLATAPYAGLKFPGSAALVPAYVVAALINPLITAVLLFGLYAVARSRRVRILAAGYLFCGLMTVPWALTFPGAFPSFHLDTGLQSTATIAAVNRLAFPLSVLVYAVSAERPAYATQRSTTPAIVWTIVAVVAAVAGLTTIVLFTDAPLPPFMLDALHVAPLWQLVPPAALAICFAGLVVLRARLRSVLDLWLMVVLASLVIEIVLLAYLSGGTRLSLGWWAGRTYGLVAGSIVLVVLLAGMTTLYAQLARSVLAERRARESRLMVMEAMSASIAHEIRQPLLGVTLSAAAGLRWLQRDPPDLDEVEAALTRIGSVGERAGRVVDSIRTIFRMDVGTPSEVDVNSVIRTVLARCEDEATVDRVAVRTALEDRLPPVLIDSVQLQLVLSNLIGNAIDAMRPVGDRQRVLAITSRHDDGRVVVSVADNGIGIAPEHRDRIFAAFFTTKADGMGVGLMFSRSIVDTNGGRLWVTDNPAHGATFHVSLPRA